MKIHELKTWPEYFQAVRNDDKTFEVRKNDRGFKVGDELLLQEFYPDDKEQPYSGRQCRLLVTYVLEGGQFGIEPGYCVLGVKKLIKGRR